MKKETLYLKIEQNQSVSHTDVTLGDIAKLECTDSAAASHLKTMKVLKFKDKSQTRYIVSVLKIIELIHKEYPDLEISNLGESDFIIEYQQNGETKKKMEWLKISAVCLITFCGSAFSIMTFNNDVSVTEVFKQLYFWLTGIESDGFTIIELMYSIGLTVGIIVFYNHIGPLKITKDPTPIEVQMRMYEKDVNSALIESTGRAKKSIDVE